MIKLLEWFYTDPEVVPEGGFWSAYGHVHLIWLGAIALVGFIAIKAFVGATKEKQDKALKGLALWILFQEITKNHLHLYAGTATVDLLPLHICGISIFFSLWYAFKPGKLNGAYIYGVSLPGALAALTFPDWMDYPLYHFSSINSFSIHGELVIFALMALISGRLKPDIRQVPKMAIIMYILAIPIYFLNKVWGTNFMFINYPSPGSPLVPLYDIFGDGYVIAAAVLLVVVWYILFLPWYLAERKQKQK